MHTYKHAGPETPHVHTHVTHTHPPTYLHTQMPHVHIHTEHTPLHTVYAVTLAHAQANPQYHTHTPMSLFPLKSLLNSDCGPGS